MSSTMETEIFIVILTIGLGTLVHFVLATEYNRVLIFKGPIEGKILLGHVIKTEKVPNEGSCRVKCFLEPNCVSINVGPADDQGQHPCELNDFTDASASQSGLEERTGHIHYAVEPNVCLSKPCPGENFICQVGFTAKRYRCVCPDGFKGENCDRDIDECEDRLHNCGDLSNCVNTHGSFYCICKLGTNCEATCEADWTSFGSSCYKPYTSAQNWTKAKVNCQNVGGKLVKIETDTENEYIRNEYLNSSGKYWIGLSDIDKEGEWKWTDGTGLAGYKKWKSGQPNDIGDQDCVAILEGDYKFGYHNAEWNDLKCSRKLGYICKKSPGEN